MNAIVGASPLWGTSLITFWHPPFFGFAPNMAYPQFLDAVYADARRCFDLMLDGARDAGLQGIELAPEPADWRGALKAYGTPQGVQAALDARGLCVGSSYMDGGSLFMRSLADAAGRGAADREVEAHARFLRHVGCSEIVMGTPSRLEFDRAEYDRVPRAMFERIAEQINRFGQVAARYGCRIALHTDAYSMCSRDEDIDTLMSLTDPATVGLCLDSGHVTLDGGDAVAILERHLSRIPVAHWKDADAAVDGRSLPDDFLARHGVMMSHFRWVGEGIIDWDRYMDVVSRAGWRGWAHAEFDFAENPVGVLRSHVNICRTRMAQRMHA